MNYTTIIESIGIVGIGSGLIVWLIKQLGQYFLTKSFKVYELELKNKSDDYKHELNKTLESHKSELNVLYLKASKLHEKRLDILSELYKKIVILDRSMCEMTIYMKRVFEDAQKEEQERIKSANGAYNQFFVYYSENKIFFTSELSDLIDQLSDKYYGSYMDYTFTQRFKTSENSTNNDMARKASETVQKQIPLIKVSLEKEFRKIIGVN